MTDYSDLDEELYESDATSEEIICTDSDTATESGKLIIYISFLFLLIT